MQPYSTDLRERIIVAVERGEHSLRPIFQNFSVCLSFVVRLFQPHPPTGSLPPAPPPGGPPPKLLRPRGHARGGSDPGRVAERNAHRGPAAHGGRGPHRLPRRHRPRSLRELRGASLGATVAGGGRGGMG